MPVCNDVQWKSKHLVCILYMYETSHHVMKWYTLISIWDTRVSILWGSKGGLHFILNINWHFGIFKEKYIDLDRNRDIWSISLDILEYLISTLKIDNWNAGIVNLRRLTEFSHAFQLQYHISWNWNLDIWHWTPPSAAILIYKIYTSRPM